MGKIKDCVSAVAKRIETKRTKAKRKLKDAENEFVKAKKSCLTKKHQAVLCTANQIISLL